jgi:hypothetical protein
MRSNDEFRQRIAISRVVIELHFTKRGSTDSMVALQKFARQSEIQIVWRNRLPARWEKRSGPLVLVVKNDRIATLNWSQILIRFCRLVFTL